jgi:uncharacterized protein (PEP-CTERM system associated)
MSVRTMGIMRMTPPNPRLRSPRETSRAIANSSARRALQCVSAALVWAVSHPSALAQRWELLPSVQLQETVTNNVDLAPSATRQSDFVTQFTPSLIIRETGDRTKLEGFVSVPILLYARTGPENNNIYPSASLTGDIALVQNFLHVEGRISIAQQLFSPFGAQPNDFSNASANRYRTGTYAVNPYISGTTPGGTSYLLRNNNVWTTLNGEPIDVSNSRYTEWLANAGNVERTLGWRANYDYTDVRFGNQTSIRTQLGRAVAVYNVDPQARLEASLGYEDNQYSLTSSRDAIYGGGVEWRPSERTSVVGKYEHRFFGGSYLASFDHRTPLSVWSISATRNITTYPQQLATVPAGLNVATFLNNLLLSSIPDAAARQQAVNQLIQTRGLPGSLVSPVDLYTQQILLQQSQTASLALVGARNTILFTIYNVRSEPITGAGTVIPPFGGVNNDNTQTGGSVVWTNKLTEAVVLLASLNAYRTVANAPGTGSTNQGIAQIQLTMPLSARTSVFAGGRYQALQSDLIGVTDYNEAAGFVGLTYTFR